MTPIKHILVVGLSILVVDHADQAERHGVGVNQEKAYWIAWSLGRAHRVPVLVNLDGKLIDISEAGSPEAAAMSKKNRIRDAREYLDRGGVLYSAKQDCEHELDLASGGGVKCRNCPGWYSA